jgi:hypothetical protein
MTERERQEAENRRIDYQEQQAEKRLLEHAARWERIERAAVRLLPFYRAMDGNTMDGVRRSIADAEALVVEIDRRRAEEAQR